MNNELKKSIFKISTSSDFKIMALQIFSDQYDNNTLYKKFCDLMLKNPSSVSEIEEIPFLPISFFKSHEILSTTSEVEKTFYSSGTTGQSTSKHLVTDVELYKTSFSLGFKNTFPDYKKSSIIGLLPSYMERNNSSLVYMVNELIQSTDSPQSGFHSEINDELLHFLQYDESPKIIIGVSFALMDLAERNTKLKNTKVIETGGMKGKRKEIIREDLHQKLCKRLGVQEIYSEYGMTELLSQAYFVKKHFQCPKWMKVFARDISDPLSIKKSGKGALNIIDLANINSCSFIATDDLCEVFTDSTFDVKGRLDHSITRGCNLLV